VEPFQVDEWPLLTPSERIARCRTFATEAQKLESAASPEMKPLYRDLYVRWTALANEMEGQSLALKEPRDSRAGSSDLLS
jgi:hypothetical protein